MPGRVIENLRDGEWHGLEVLNENIPHAKVKLVNILRLLREMELVEIEEKNDKDIKVRITPLGSRLIEL